ncbi:MAG: signal recognition particle-docking protein FtsY [Syntrophobacterales bacterium]|jgi:fused signal recognition particle receptor|nr:signal recognition particle-docking protein FtsY [Syntrophobacterales bacterium]
MRRWFRKKDKDQGAAGEEDAAALREETEPILPAASEGAETAEVTGLEAEAPEAPAEEQTAAAPSARRGFFRRWRRGAPEEDAVTEAEAAGEAAAAPVEVIPEVPAEPAAAPEAEAPEVMLSAEAEVVSIPEAEALEIAPEIPEAEDLEAAEEVPEAERRGMFRRLRERLTRTREALSGGMDRLFHGRKVVDAELLDELEELLITADLGVETSLFLIQALQDKLRRRELGDVDKLKAALKAEMVALLTGPPAPERNARPWVVLMVGVNGVGKTTTLAKLAHRDRTLGLTTMLVAADTFRAAAVEQLEIWGERVGAAVVKQKTGADPAAVVFDGMAAALARGVDTVYVDTAGRLHTKVNLMEELKKIHRTAAKKIPDAPHEVFLILDATTGQNALSQARLFHEAVGLTGLVLTKMDGTAKGGVALAVVHQTGIPLRYIGVGEGMEDLRPFDPEAFVEAILG